MIIHSILGSGTPFRLLQIILLAQLEDKKQELNRALFPSQQDIFDYVGEGGGTYEDAGEGQDALELFKGIADRTAENLSFFERQNKSDKETLLREIAEIKSIFKHIEERDYAAVKAFLSKEIAEHEENTPMQLIAMRVMHSYSKEYFANEEDSGEKRAPQDLEFLVRAETELLKLILNNLEAYAPD